MSTVPIKPIPVWRTPLLCFIGIVVVLGMFRLGFWQLSRAEEKRNIVVQLESRVEQPFVSLQAMTSKLSLDELRFRNVSLSGRYLEGSDILIDNQVVNGQVGYQVFTPFIVNNVDLTILIARGWVSAGSSREGLPIISTPTEQISLDGRLNNAPAKPPLWNDKYAVSKGKVWQYLPISDVADVLHRQVFPLVVELAPDSGNSNSLVRKWPDISDQSVAKHQGYAFQWFAMATAFFVACLVLLLRRSRKIKK